MQSVAVPVLGVSEILCVSRLMNSLTEREALAELDGELRLGSMPRDRRFLPVLGNVA